MELQKVNNVDVLSFQKPERGDRLTGGQKIILKMLAEKIKSGLPITQFDVNKCFIDARHPTGKKDEWGWDREAQAWKIWKRDISPDMEWVQYYSKQWFKNNLGSCIVKGKLLAIPVIDIN